MNYEEYVNAAKEAALATAKKSLIEALLKKVPFFFVGPFGFITTLAVEKCLEILIRETEFGVYFFYTDLRVNKQGQDYTRVALENYRIQQTGTEDEKKQSEARLIATFKNFISFHT